MRMARRDQLGLAVTSLSAAAMQVALFVTPVLVLASIFMGRPMSLAFGLQELIARGLTVFIVGQLAGDGRSNWFEGVQSLAVYALLVLWFLFFPSFPTSLSELAAAWSVAQSPRMRSNSRI